MIQIDLGFINTNQDDNFKKLKSKYFVSKVGGKPLWLSFSKLLTCNQLICNFCHHQLIFLLQIYAPISNNPEAFHRTLFVWACVHPQCFKGFKVFRSQLRRDNPFYDYDPPNYDNYNDEKYDPKPQDFNLNTCKVCGIFSSQCCSKCKSTFYCCKNHQSFDWKKGKHKYQCNGKVDPHPDTKSESLLFNEYELLIESGEDEENAEDIHNEEDEDQQSDRDNDNNDESRQKCFNWYLDEYKPQLQNENLDEYIQESIKDGTFDKFKKTIKGYEDQVIRYYSQDEDAKIEPLWMSEHCKPTSIPVCENCKAERKLEFQIMPQLINYLNSEIDFGTLVVYTCSKSCTSQEKAYFEEFIWPHYIK